MANLGTAVATNSTKVQAEGPSFSFASVGKELREIALGFLDLAQGVTDKIEDGLGLVEQALDPIAIRVLQERPLTPMERFCEDNLSGIFYLGEEKIRQEKKVG